MYKKIIHFVFINNFKLHKPEINNDVTIKIQTKLCKNVKPENTLIHNIKNALKLLQIKHHLQTTLTNSMSGNHLYYEHTDI